MFNLNNYILNITADMKSAVIPVQIQSDSGNIWSITGRRYRVLYTAEGTVSRDAKVFEAFRNIVRQEQARMQAAANVLFDRQPNGQIFPKPAIESDYESWLPGYHYAEITNKEWSIVKGIAQKDIVVDGKLWYAKGSPVTIAPADIAGFKKGYPTGRVFTFSALDYFSTTGKVSINDISNLKVWGVFDQAVNTPENQKAIDDHIAAFIADKTTKERARYNKYRAKVVHSKKGNGTPLLSLWLTAEIS